MLSQPMPVLRDRYSCPFSAPGERKWPNPCCHAMPGRIPQKERQISKMGGILYVPNGQEYLADNNVSALLQKTLGAGDPKLIVSMLNSDWQTEQGKPIYRHGRVITPPAPKSDEIKRIVLARKSDLERQQA